MSKSAYAWKSAAFLLLSLGARPALADYGYAYAWVPGGAAPAVSAQYSLNSANGPITVSRGGTGTYTVTFTNSGIDTGWSVQATAYGTNSNYCNVESWGGSQVIVDCFNTAGTAADSDFSVLAVSNQNDKNIAFAWADKPTTASYTPNTDYSFNPGGAITITRSGTGTYQVLFNGLNGDGGDVQIDAYGSNATCYSGGWGGSFLANVDCVNAAGAAVDSFFVINVVPATVSATGLAFSWASSASAPIYTPDATYTYNSVKKATSITRSSVGQYTVTFAGLAAGGVAGGNVRATSYTSTARCKVQGWSPGSDGSWNVSVGCYSLGGSPFDAEYEVLFVPPSGFAYSWIFDGSTGSPSATYSVNPGDAAVTGVRNSTGNYTITFPNSGIGEGWSVQATAYGGGSNYCKVQGWGGSVADILCFTAAGAAADSEFTVQAVSSTNERSIAFAWADQDTTASYTPSVFYSYNPAGGITITRSSTGAYNVIFNGLDGSKGDVQVTAYGSGNVTCAGTGWGGTPFDASVNCQTPSGAAADSDFVIWVVPTGATPSLLGYAWADQASTASYTPDTTYSYNSGHGTITATRSSTGTYAVLFNGLNQNGIVGGDVHVTSYQSNTRCKVISWGGVNVSVSVLCTNLAGTATDSRFQVLVFAAQPGAASQILVNAGSGQTATVNTAFGTALSAVVRDSNGVVLPGVNVTFTAPSSGASGTFGASLTTTATTNSNGVATAPAFTANGTAGSYIVTASALGVSTTANFSLTNAAASACTIGLSTTTISLPATGTSTPETCPNGSGQPTCGVQPETPRTFTVTPGASCGSWTATSSNPGFLQIVSGASGSGTGTVSFDLLVNTHTTSQTYTVTITSGSATNTVTVSEAGNADSEVLRQVYALYEQLLGRDPDAAGFAFWTGVGGAGLGQMADSFLTSPEAFNTDFVVMATYQAATGLPPTYAQYAAAVPRIRNGSLTVTSLFNSLLPGGYTATTLYGNLLDRTPTAAEITSANGAGLANWFQTLIGFPNSNTPVSSPNNEFQSTGTFHGSLSSDNSNPLYMQMVYYVTLSRDPDPAGLNFWIGVANTGGPGILFQGSADFNTRIQILGPGTPNQGFIGSPEFQGLFAN